MSKKIENQCVGCPTEIGCHDRSCLYSSVPVYICDECGSDNAKYVVDGLDLCDDCTDKYLEEIFNDLSLADKVDAVSVDLYEID